MSNKVKETGMSRQTLTIDDAVAAAGIIREADAGHESAAEALAIAAGLGDLTDDQLRTLCDIFDIEI